LAPGLLFGSLINLHKSLAGYRKVNVLDQSSDRDCVLFDISMGSSFGENVYGISESIQDHMSVNSNFEFLQVDPRIDGASGFLTLGDVQWSYFFVGCVWNFHQFRDCGKRDNVPTNKICRRAPLA